MPSDPNGRRLDADWIRVRFVARLEGCGPVRAVWLIISTWFFSKVLFQVVVPSLWNWRTEPNRKNSAPIAPGAPDRSAPQRCVFILNKFARLRRPGIAPLRIAPAPDSIPHRCGAAAQGPRVSVHFENSVILVGWSFSALVGSRRMPDFRFVSVFHIVRRFWSLYT